MQKRTRQYLFIKFRKITGVSHLHPPTNRHLVIMRQKQLNHMNLIDYTL